jgi:hypothetical protein
VAESKKFVCSRREGKPGKAFCAVNDQAPSGDLRPAADIQGGYWALEQYLDGLNAYLFAVEHIHGRFEEQRASIEAKFLNAFPDFDSSRARIYLMLSMFRFDGKIPHDNPRMLLLGLDGLAKFHGTDARLPVILSHELFHVYHFK